MNEQVQQKKYPIGKYIKPDFIEPKMISTIENFPNLLYRLVLNIDDEALNKTYREGGWTIKQIVHHCADSHLNAFIRFKLTLTEYQPTIKPYMEALWAELADAKAIPIEPSLQLIEALHYRWTVLLKAMEPIDFLKTYIHPEHNRIFLLEEAVVHYAWHCKHHLEHIKTALQS